MLPFAMLYSLGLILCGLSADPRLRYGGAVAWLLAAGAMGHASGGFVGAALGYVALSAWMRERRLSPWRDWGRVAAWLAASAVLVVHAWPGDLGVALVEESALKPGSVPFDLVFHPDKVLVAWSLLGWLPLFGQSALPAGAPRPWWTMPLLAVAGVLSLMGLAVALELVAWQPGLTPWFAAFAVANLLNTCVAEELLFRGVLQRWLVARLGGALGLTAAAALFGLAHFPGGAGFVAVAAGAGLLYGLVYRWTGRLAWAVLVHWGVNLVHFTLFTYPLAAR
ncbi:CPBP family intramembrane glutamic endopeptidase [Halomonas sp. THAF12]|uniref:CPBP family intramembrane glutamic endopeptidase n=1 Tax=Halomonas sp. B23F22_10 TaxID=3459515 RepID=UPI00373ED3C6